MITHTVSSSCASDAGGAPVAGRATESGSSEQRIVALPLAAATVDQLVPMAFTAANVQSVALVASADCTIETNSGSSPAQTISLKAGRPLIWRKSDGYFPNPFTANVTGFYVTCTVGLVLSGRILVS